MLQPHAYGKAIKPSMDVLKSLIKDLDLIFKARQDSSAVAPFSIYDIAFVGRDGMGLAMKYVPAKI